MPAMLNQKRSWKQRFRLLLASREACQVPSLADRCNIPQPGGAADSDEIEEPPGRGLAAA